MNADPGSAQYVAFAHGTSLASAVSIVANGLDEAAGQRNSSRGLLARPGFFFAHRIDPADPARAMQSAHEFGLRKASEPVVLVAEWPRTLVDSLAAAGLITVRAIPGTIPETIFHPAAYGALNRHERWQIVDPYGSV